MTNGWANDNARRRPARWLLVPLTVALFALIGMAISAEDRQRSEEETVSVGPPGGASSLDEVQTASDGAAEPPPADGASAPSTTAPADGAATTASTTSADDAASAGNDGESGTQPVNVEISGPGGRLGVQVGGAAPVARPIGADGTAGAPSELADGPQGPLARAPGTGDGTSADGAGTGTGGTLPDGTPTDGTPTGAGDGQPVVGLRLGPDGQLQPVSQSQIAPGDLVVAPAGGGLDVVRPDGSRVQIRPGASADGSGLVASEATADGVSGLKPDGSGRIDVGDGVTVTLPTPDPIDLSTEADSGLAGLPWAWVVALAALAVALMLGLWLWLRQRRRRQGAAPTADSGAVAPPIPAHQLEALLATLAADPDPARAIRLAFSAAERGIGRLPARHSTETPFEWYRRVGAAQPDLAEPLAGLCACFANTRFSATPPTTADRDAAVAELQRLHQLSRGPAPASVGDPTGNRPEVGAGV